MIKFLLLVGLALFTTTFNAQERINRENIKFQNQIGELDKAIGWSFNNSTGDWVEYENLIFDNPSFKDSDKIIASPQVMSRKDQNFLKIEFKDVIYDGIKYYVLLVSKWNGRYEYPSIYKGWILFNQLEGFIYSTEEFNKLNNLQKGDEVVLKTKMQISTHIDSDYTIQDPLDRIQYVLNHNSSSYEYQFPIILSDEGKIRFLIPDHYASYEKPYDFEKEYFEIEKEVFENLIGVN